MAYVVTLNCLGTKDRSCVEVCPVDCFYNIKKRKYNDRFKRDPKGDDEGMLMIHPDECIHCGACETVPENLKEFVQINASETSSMSDEQLDQSRCTSK